MKGNALVSDFCSSLSLSNLAMYSSDIVTRYAASVGWSHKFQ